MTDVQILAIMQLITWGFMWALSSKINTQEQKIKDIIFVLSKKEQDVQERE